MRGAHGLRRDGQLQQGIIPAHAGSTDFPQKVYHFRQDHPRACGEHLDEIAEAARAQGSSPRMRGAR